MPSVRSGKQIHRNLPVRKNGSGNISTVLLVRQEHIHQSCSREHVDKLEFVCLSYNLVYKGCNLLTDTVTFIIMNVMSAIQEYCLCFRLFGK